MDPDADYRNAICGMVYGILLSIPFWGLVGIGMWWFFR